MEEPSSQAVGSKWRQFGKHWIVVFVLAIIAGLIVWGMLKAGPFLKTLHNKRVAIAEKSRQEKAYREDKLGGNTPEETYAFFVSALEKGDVELASKYFVLARQEQWRKTLIDYKDNALLLGFIKELKDVSSRWKKANSQDSNFAVFNYETSSQNHRMINEIIFEKYPSGVWKINDL